MAKQFIFVDANGDYEESVGAYEQADFINVSAGVADAGKPIVLDATGKIDPSMLDFGDIDHGSLSGLSDDDHIQYILVNGTRAFTGSQSMGSFNLTNLADPTASTIDAASADAIPMSFLASTANAEGASRIGIEDASAFYAGSDLESVMNEIEALFGSVTSSTFDFSENNVLADNDSVYPALEKLDLKWGDLASQNNGEGASLVGIEDAAGNFTSINVEGALLELSDRIKDFGTVYTVGAGGVTIGDLVYISANDTVSTYATITDGFRVPGIALSTEAAASTVRVLANDTILEGVLVGATAGDRYYWDGTNLTTTIPNTAGQYVWVAGIAKNATDLHVEVQFVKKNA